MIGGVWVFKMSVPLSAWCLKTFILTAHRIEHRASRHSETMGLVVQGV